METGKSVYHSSFRGVPSFLDTRVVNLPELNGGCDSWRESSRDLSAYVAAGKGSGTDLKPQHMVVKLER